MTRIPILSHSLCRFVESDTYIHHTYDMKGVREQKNWLVCVAHAMCILTSHCYDTEYQRVTGTETGHRPVNFRALYST